MKHATATAATAAYRRSVIRAWSWGFLKRNASGRGSRIAGVLEIKLIEVPFETEYKHAE